MSIQAVRLAKTSKIFYRNGFRKVIVLLFFSLALNGLLSFAIYNKIINMKVPAYYSTNGLTPPEILAPMSEPNYSFKALLPPDPDRDEDDEVMMTYG